MSNLDKSISAGSFEDSGEAIKFIKERSALFADEYAEGFSEDCMRTIGFGADHKGVSEGNRAYFVYEAIKGMILNQPDTDKTTDLRSMGYDDLVKFRMLVDSVVRAAVDAMGEKDFKYDGYRIGAPGTGWHTKFQTTRLIIGDMDQPEGQIYPYHIYENLDPRDRDKPLPSIFLGFEQLVSEKLGEIGIPYYSERVNNIVQAVPKEKITRDEVLWF